MSDKITELLEDAPREYPYFEGLSMFEYCVIHPSWHQSFMEIREYLEDINNVLKKDVIQNGDFFPDKANIFRACSVPLKEIKVVIIGQDPYPGRHSITGHSRAQGLSFSVDDQDEIPSSLSNMYRELAEDIPGWTIPNHGDLSYWANQGVMMLNSSLTVRPNEPNSHQTIWDGIVINIIQEVQKNNPNVVFVLWGRHAQDMQSRIKDKTKRLCAAHPSGRSASKGFFGCRHFSKINKHLRLKDMTEIDWTIPNVVRD
jgi:uracil-DNA glycosylase